MSSNKNENKDIDDVNAYHFIFNFAATHPNNFTVKKESSNKNENKDVNDLNAHYFIFNFAATHPNESLMESGMRHKLSDDFCDDDDFCNDEALTRTSLKPTDISLQQRGEDRTHSDSKFLKSRR